MDCFSIESLERLKTEQDQGFAIAGIKSDTIEVILEKPDPASLPTSTRRESQTFAGERPHEGRSVPFTNV